MKITKKITNLLINRFWEKANELPHEISYSHKENGWKVYLLKSFNYTHEIGYKNNLGDQICLLS